MACTDLEVTVLWAPSKFPPARPAPETALHKINQYDRYLQSLRYQRTYAEWGQFRFFTLLFITIGQTRLENIRQKLGGLPQELANYYRFTEYEQALGDFLSPIWKSRNANDTRLYSLVRET